MRRFFVTIVALHTGEMAGFVYAAEKIGEEKILRVESFAAESELEREAYGAVVQEEEFQRLRADQRAARIEAIKLQLTRKRRKRFSQSITYQTFYDKNYFKEKRELAKETLGFHIIPQTMLDLGGDRVKGIVTYSPSVEVPVRFKENLVTRFYQNFSARADVPIGKRTFVRGNYRLFRGVDRATTETVNFSLRTENHVSSEIEYFVGKKVSTAFEHTWTERHFTEEVEDSHESREHWFFPRFSVYLTPKTSLFIQAGAGQTRGGNGQYDSTNLRASVGVSGRLTAKSATLINFGYMRKQLDETPPFVENSDTPFLELVYIWKTGKRFLPELRITAGSNTEDSFTSGSPFFANQSMGVDMKFPILARLAILLGIRGQLNTYAAKETAAASVASSELAKDGSKNGQRVDQVYGFSYGLQYRISRNASVLLGGDSSFRNSTLGDNREDKDRSYQQGIYKAELSLSF